MGKRYKDALKTFDRQTYYPMEEALKLVKDNAKAKFDETIEVHFRLGIDPRHSDQQIRTTVMLPHGTGKTIRILAFVEEGQEEATLAAGADIIGTDEVINQIRNDGWLEFDATVATPPMMRKIGPIARILGPRGLMPNPKAGTVVPPDEIPRVINELKAGGSNSAMTAPATCTFPLAKPASRMSNWRRICKPWWMRCRRPSPKRRRAPTSAAWC